MLYGLKKHLISESKCAVKCTFAVFTLNAWNCVLSPCFINWNSKKVVQPIIAILYSTNFFNCSQFFRSLKFFLKKIVSVFWRWKQPHTPLPWIFLSNNQENYNILTTLLWCNRQQIFKNTMFIIICLLNDY